MSDRRSYADEIDGFDAKRAAYASGVGGLLCCAHACYQTVSRDEICAHLLDVDTMFASMGLFGVEMFCRACYFMSLQPQPSLRAGRGVAARRRAAPLGSSAAVFGDCDGAASFCVHEGGGKVGNHAFRVPAIASSVCRRFFLDLFAISHNTLASWCAVSAGRCATPPLRAAFAQPAHNAKVHAANRMVRFVLTFAEDFGQPWPVYHEGGCAEVMYFLPPCISERELWRLYNLSVKDADDDMELAWSTFEGLFKSRVELVSIKTQSNNHNCCAKCSALKLSLDRSPSESEHREKVQNEIQAHLVLVNTMREEKQAAIESAVKCPRELSVVEVDFKSSVKIPHKARETSDEFQPFSLHGLDVNVMGVLDHGNNRAHVVLYLEGSATDSNHTIAGFESYFVRAGNARQVIAYFDSCSGQNRNQNMVRYLASRVLKGFHHSVTMRFFPVGHTHATVDALFGWVDKAFKVSDAYTIDELIGVIRAATRSPEATLVEAQMLSETKVANFWTMEEKFVKVDLRLKKDPIYEIRLERSASQGVSVTIRMQNGDVRVLPTDLVACSCALPSYDEIPRVTAPSLSLQRRRALADSIIPLIPRDALYEERIDFWRGVAKCDIASSEKVGVDPQIGFESACEAPANPSPSVAAPSIDAIESSRLHVADILVESIAIAKERGKRSKVTWLDDRDVDAIALPPTEDWKEFSQRLSKSKKRFVMHFKDGNEREWLGWALGRVVDVRPVINRMKVEVGDTVTSMVGHRFDAEFDDGRENNIVFEKDCLDMRVLKEERGADTERHSPAGEGEPLRKCGRPRKQQ